MKHSRREFVYVVTSAAAIQAACAGVRNPSAASSIAATPPVGAIANPLRADLGGQFFVGFQTKNGGKVQDVLYAAGLSPKDSFQDFTDASGIRRNDHIIHTLQGNHRPLGWDIIINDGHYFANMYDFVVRPNSEIQIWMPSRWDGVSP